MPTHLLLQGVSLVGLGAFSHLPEGGLKTLTRVGATVLEVSANDLTDELIEAARNCGLSVVMALDAGTDCSLDEVFGRARNAKAVAINARLEAEFLSGGNAEAMVRAMIGEAGAAGIPLYFHFGNGDLPVDSLSLFNLMDTVREMQFALDVTGWGQWSGATGAEAVVTNRLESILDRMEMVRGRVGDDGEALGGEADKLQVALLTEAMRRWRIRKPVGSALIFMLDANGDKLGEAWSIAQAAWKAGAAAGKNSVWPVQV